MRRRELTLHIALCWGGAASPKVAIPGSRNPGSHAPGDKQPSPLREPCCHNHSLAVTVPGASSVLGVTAPSIRSKQGCTVAALGSPSFPRASYGPILQMEKPSPHSLLTGRIHPGWATPPFPSLSPSPVGCTNE